MASVTAKQNAILQRGVLWLCITQIDSLLLSFDAFWNMPMISKHISHAFLFSMGNKIMRCCPVSRASFGKLIFSSFLVLSLLPASLHLVTGAQDDNGKGAGKKCAAQTQSEATETSICWHICIYSWSLASPVH